MSLSSPETLPTPDNRDSAWNDDFSWGSGLDAISPTELETIYTLVDPAAEPTIPAYLDPDWS